MQKEKVLIIGSGPAGYTAAIYAARACLDPLLISGMEKGGQLSTTTDVENYPGFADVIQGPWLMEQMEQQVLNCGGRIENDAVVSIDIAEPTSSAQGNSQSNGQRISKKHSFIITLESKKTIEAETVILCTGAQAKWLGLDTEKLFMGYGVSACATCDAFFYRGKDVMVIGGGNTAAEEAIYLTNHANKVTLVHRRDSLRAEKTLQNRVLNHPKINVIWDSALQEVLGQETAESKYVTGAKILNLKTNEENIVPIDGIFIAIGHAPNTALVKKFSSLQFDNAGYLITKPDSTATQIDGLFAAGDVQDSIFRQAVTAAGTGCMAALEAEKYLSL